MAMPAEPVLHNIEDLYQVLVAHGRALQALEQLPAAVRRLEQGQQALEQLPAAVRRLEQGQQAVITRVDKLEANQRLILKKLDILIGNT